MLRRGFAVLFPALAIGVALSAATVLAHSDPLDCNGGDAAWDAAVSYDAINDECDLNSAIVQNGTVAVEHTLHIGPAGKITTTTGPGPATGGLTLNITDHDGPGGGGLIIDTPSGAAGTNGISGDVVNAFGRPITINATGDVTLHGNGTKGARISSSRTGLGDAPGGGGNITINAGPRNPDGSCATPPTGDVLMEPGSSVLANSTKSRAGDIIITACRHMDIDGRVESRSTQTGVPGDTLGGRQITLDAACELIVTDAGVVSSQSNDPRADRVHLEGGCLVTIHGLVQSIAVGHDDSTGVNGCKAPDRPDKPANSTNCVEIWSGGPLIVDSTGTHNGQVNADSGNSPGGNSGTGWADLYAKGDITIIGCPIPDPTNDCTPDYFAVHADGEGGSGGAAGESGGLVTVKSTEGKVSTSGRAISAYSGNQGANSDGGSIVVEAFNNADLGAALFDSGGRDLRGIISVRSFNGQVTGNSPGLLDTCGVALGLETGGQDNTCVPAVPVSPNLVTLQGCGTVAPGDGVAYSGTTDPTPFTNPGDACGGAPTLPSYVTLPECACLCSKSGTKFEDLNGDGDRDEGEPGLEGWTINLYLDDGDGVFDGDALVATDTTDEEGFYEFTGLAPGVYHVQEVCPLTGWIQTMPLPTSASYADCGTGIYTITLEPGEHEIDNDFGNFRPITKSGIKFVDPNGDGDLTDGVPLDGWTITLYLDDGDGVPDTDDQFLGDEDTGSGSWPDGYYEFPDLGPAGTYFVCEEAMAGWMQTYPSVVGGEVIDTCDDIPGNAAFGYKFTAISGVDKPDNDFGNFELGTKGGTKYEDPNGDGDLTDGVPLPGWTINLYNDDGTTAGVFDGSDTLNTFDVTDDNGEYEFTNLRPGTYHVVEDCPPGWIQTVPAPTTPTEADCGTGIYTITVTSGFAEEDNDFGNMTSITKWCNKCAVLSQVQQNMGECCAIPDILVDVTLPHGGANDVVLPSEIGTSVPATWSIQVAVDYVNLNGDPSPGDGEIFIGVTAKSTEAPEPVNCTGPSAGPCNGQIGWNPNGDGTENVVITNEHPERLNVFGCSVDLFAADSELPVVTIEDSVGKVTVMDIHAREGSIGYLVQNNDDKVVVKNSRSMDNAGQGYLVTDDDVEITGSPEISGNGGHGIEINGNLNQVRSSHVVDNRGSGIDIDGDENEVNGTEANGNDSDGIHVVGDLNEIGDANEAHDNDGDGIDVAGDDNQITRNDVGKANVGGNGGDGIHLAGNNNEISENDVYANVFDGIDVAGNGNLIKKNNVGDTGNDKGGNGGDGIHVFGEANATEENSASVNGGDGFDFSGGADGAPNTSKKNESNTGDPGDAEENAGVEYRFLNWADDLGDNSADNLDVGNGEAKCPAPAQFPAAGGTNFAAEATCE